MKKNLFILLTLLVASMIPAHDSEAAAVRLSQKSKTLSIINTGSSTQYDTYKIKIKKPKNVKIQKVTYKSSKRSIASVSKKGVVTAKGIGTCKVKSFVTYQKGKKVYKKTLTLKITVQTKNGTLSLNKKTILAHPGETVTLKLNNWANKQITWYCSNSNVATFKKANKNKVWIYAKSPGVATITVKCNGETFTCEITVQEAE